MFESIVTAVQSTFAASGVASGLVVFVLRTRPRALAAALPLVTAAALALGVAWAGPFPSLPPHSAVGWTPWLVLAAAVLGVPDTLAGRFARTRGLRWVLPLGLALATAWLILRRLVPHHLDGAGFLRAGACASAALFVLLAVPAAVERRRRHPLPRAPMAVALLAAVPSIGWSSSGTLAAQVAILGAAVIGAWIALAVAARGRPRERLGYVPGVGLGAILTAAWAYADLQWPHGLLLIASALCVVIDGRAGTRRLAHVGLALSIALAGTAAALAHHAAVARGATPLGL